MKIKQFEIWLADLNPRFGTEAGKVRPVLIVQTDMLNKFHPSVIVCPLTTNVQPQANLLRVHLKKGEAGMKGNCDIMIDQVRAIDSKRLLKRIGKITQVLLEKVKEDLKIIMDLD